MRMIGVIALMLAILLFVAAGAIGVARWAIFDGRQMITDTLGEIVVPALDFVKTTYNNVHLNMQLLLMLIVVSAGLFVIAILSFAIVNARKKRAIDASLKKVKGTKKKQNDTAQKAIPFLAAGVVLTAAVVAAAVVLKKKDTSHANCCCCSCCRHR